MCVPRFAGGTRTAHAAWPCDVMCDMRGLMSCTPSHRLGVCARARRGECDAERAAGAQPARGATWRPQQYDMLTLKHRCASIPHSFITFNSFTRDTRTLTALRVRCLP